MSEFNTDDLDLASDDAHAGDDWESVQQEAQQYSDPGTGAGQALAVVAPEQDPDAAGWSDLLSGAFRSSSHVFGLRLAEEEIAELARAWGRVAGHYLPECPTKASPLADALYTTGTIAAPRVVAHFTGAGREQEQGDPIDHEQGRPSNVVNIRDPNGDWVSEEEKKW